MKHRRLGQTELRVSVVGIGLLLAAWAVTCVIPGCKSVVSGTAEQAEQAE